MSRRRLIAIRHAKASAEGVCYGRSDVEVELAPEAAARILSSSTMLDSVDIVWSSSSARCRELAAAWAKKRELPHVVDDRLLELDFGRWEGRAWSAIHAEEPEALALWGERWRDLAPPGGESLASLEARVGEWMSSLDGEGTHLLFAHAGVVRALRVLGGESSWEQAMASSIPHLEAIDIILD